MTAEGVTNTSPVQTRGNKQTHPNRHVHIIDKMNERKLNIVKL